MTIRIKSDNKKFVVPVPLWRGLITFVLNIALKHSETNRETILVLKETLTPVIKELKRFKRKNGKFTLVYIKSGDGEEIKITV